MPKIELERSAIGPKAKQDMGKLLKIFADTDPELIINELRNNDTYTFQIGDNSVILDKKDFIGWILRLMKNTNLQRDRI